MTDTLDTPSDKALLPTGMSDTLAPDAAFEADAVHALMRAFHTWGYDRVKPPMLEFEESLLSGSGSASAQQTFRLMDPESRRMMGLRLDVTPQAARIATTRLADAPRPLRLSYSGEVLRVRGGQLRPERQFCQVGAEIIGTDAVAADAEVIIMAASALRALGVKDLSVDLGLPTLVPLITDALGVDDRTASALRAALDGKDAASVSALSETIGGKAPSLFPAILAATGPAADAVAAIGALDLPEAAASAWANVVEVVDRLAAESPDLFVTADPSENRGFEYHTGLTFTVFAKGVRGELGSGGRYRAGQSGQSAGEQATGFSLFMDSVLRALPAPPAVERVYLPAGTPADAACALRAKGQTVVQGLTNTPDPASAAIQMGCTHIFESGTVRTLTSKG